MSNFKVGDRVRVTSFGEGYDGLLGGVAQIDEGSPFGFLVVVLDEDPLPSLRGDGLPVLPDEIEKIDG